LDPDEFPKTPDKFPMGFYSTPYTGYEGPVKNDVVDGRMDQEAEQELEERGTIYTDALFTWSSVCYL